MDNEETNCEYIPTWIASNQAQSQNQLLSLASPIITTAISLANKKTVPDNLSQLQLKLSNAIKKIASKMHAAGYIPQQAFACRYLLCAIIDNSVKTSCWGKKTDWKDNSLAKTLQAEQWSSKEFFKVLQRCANHPQQNINFLELAYYCLNIGILNKEASDQEAAVEVIIKNLGDCLKHNKRNPDFNLLQKPKITGNGYLRSWPKLNVIKILSYTGAIVLIFIAVNFYHTNSLTSNLTLDLKNISRAS
jgi:type IV/VI secretion system ImpK/VasF family protein